MHKPNWMLLKECGEKLTKEGTTPFTRQQLIDCVHEVYPDRNVSSLNSVIQGLTVNARGGASSGVGKNVFYRVDRGFYELYDPVKYGTDHPKVASSPFSYRGSKEHILVHCELISAARYRGTTTYQTIADIMGLPLSGAYMGTEVGRILGEISRQEVEQGRPMLSAVVVGTSGQPGHEFFGLAGELGKLQESSSEAEKRFWETELTAVYETWRREFNA